MASEEARGLASGENKMHTATKNWISAAFAAVTAVSAGAAHAVASYGDIVDPPGALSAVYFGTGNVNGNFTIDTSNGIEVALRAKDRETFATLDGSGGFYNARMGTMSGPKALWNYEFSINTHGGGGVLDLTQVVAKLYIDTNPGAGTTFNVFNVFGNWGDTEYADGTTKRAGSTPNAGEFTAQQSSNPLFGDSGFMPGFNPNAPGMYDLRLAVYASDGITLLAQTQTQVQVPEPSSLWLMGIAFLGLGFAARRKLG